MQRTSDIIGRAVVSAASGDKLGTVADVLVATESGRVAGFVVHDGLFSKERVLPFDDVQTLGGDAVIARSADPALDAKQWQDRGVAAVRSLHLSHRRVITTAGRDVGAVNDLYVDEQSGSIRALEVEVAAFAGLVQKHRDVPFTPTVALGDDAVVVPEEVGRAIEQQDDPP